MRVHCVTAKPDVNFSHVAGCTELMRQHKDDVKHWGIWQQKPDPNSLDTDTLVSFARIGKLVAAFDSCIWEGREQHAMALLSLLPPFLYEQVVAQRTWLGSQTNHERTTNSWAHRIADQSIDLTTRGSHANR